MTPREWQTKAAWAKHRKSSGGWKDVIVLDCNDLEHWLGLSTGTDLWFSTLTGRRPAGVVSLSDRWLALSTIAEVPLDPSVFLTSRENQEGQMLDWLRGEVSSLLIRAKSFDVGADFLSALIAKHSADICESEQFALISNRDAWHQLAASQDRLILVPTDELALDASEVADAVRFGHRVVVCDRQSVGISPETTVDLPEPDYYKLSDALVACGMAEARARSVSRGCCGSTTVLKRLGSV